jgi:transcriptional regulator with XRE-family HTH domain
MILSFTIARQGAIILPMTIQDIKNIIEESGLTQKDFAAKVGLSPVHLSKVMTLKAKLTENTVLKVEKFLRMRQEIADMKPDLDRVQAFAVRLTEEEVKRLLVLSGREDYDPQKAEEYVRELLQKAWHSLVDEAEDL